MTEVNNLCKQPGYMFILVFVYSSFLFFLILYFFYFMAIDMQEATEDFKVVLVKRLRFSKGELLEGHAWSSDDEIFAVAGCKIYLFKVSIILS